MGVSGQEKDRHDHYFLLAKKEGYRARSIYKLKEIDQRFKLFRTGMKVIDLGAAPGSWTQYVAQKVGPTGKVIAIDRTPIEPGLPPHVSCLARDMLEIDANLLQEVLGLSTVQVVISDMAANTSGIRSVDHQRSIVLCDIASTVAHRLLETEGAFVCKVFQGGDVEPLVARLRLDYASVHRFKPQSSKDESVEFFLVAMGFKGCRAPILELEKNPREVWNPLDDG